MESNGVKQSQVDYSRVKSSHSRVKQSQVLAGAKKVARLQQHRFKQSDSRVKGVEQNHGRVKVGKKAQNHKGKTYCIYDMIYTSRVKQCRVSKVQQSQEESSRVNQSHGKVQQSQDESSRAMVESCRVKQSHGRVMQSQVATAELSIELSIESSRVNKVESSISTSRAIVE